MSQTFKEFDYKYYHESYDFDLANDFDLEEHIILCNIDVNGVLLGDIPLTEPMLSSEAISIQLYNYTLTVMQIVDVKYIICTNNDVDGQIPYNRFMYMAKNQYFRPVDIKSARNV